MKTDSRLDYGKVSETKGGTLGPAGKESPMLNAAARLFTNHPSSVDETYFQHLQFAAGFAGWLMLACVAAAIHAVLPFLFEKTACNIINRLHHRMNNRRSH